MVKSKKQIQKKHDVKRIRKSLFILLLKLSTAPFLIHSNDTPQSVNKRRTGNNAKEKQTTWKSRFRRSPLNWTANIPS